METVQSFLVFTNFNRNFSKDCYSIASPLYKLTEKENRFCWFSECNHAFKTLKKCLTTAPLLMTPRTGPNESFVISTDASNKGIGTILLQEQYDSSLRARPYYAKNLNNTQEKYPVYDQELLVIAATLNEYRYLYRRMFKFRGNQRSSTINPYSYTTQYRTTSCFVGIGHVSIHGIYKNCV